MPGKSLDQIWRQMQAQAQAQRQAEAQRQAARERAINEARERARQEYLLQMKMNERVAPAAAASAAAGAGAGGSGNRREQPVLVEAQQSMMFYTDIDGVFNYFIYNFDSGQVTDIKALDGGLWSGSGAAYVEPVSYGGYYVDFNNNDTSTKYMHFVGLNGEVVWQDTKDNGDYLNREAFSRYMAIYYAKDGAYKLAVFYQDGTHKVYDFDNYVSGGGYSYDYVYSGGFVVHEEIGNIRRYYLLNDKKQPILFTEFDDEVDSVQVYQYAFSETVATVTNDHIWRVYDKTGAMICEFDIYDGLSSWSLSDFGYLSANGSFIMDGVNGDTNEYFIFFYSGPANQFSSKSISDNYTRYYNIFDQQNYEDLNEFNPKGAGFYWFNTDDDNENGVSYNEENYILPVWSSDSTLRDFFTFSYEMGVVEEYSNSAFMRNEDYMGFLVNNRGRVYLFSDSPTNESYIEDGGDDMYDDGNYLYGDSISITYSHTQLSEYNDGGMNLEDYPMDGAIVPGMGASGSYFTNMYPGLFLLAAQGTEIDEFKVDGYLGADGGGSQSAYDFQLTTGLSPSTTWQVFVKQVYGAQDPSVNQMIIVNAATASGLTHSFPDPQNTDSDLHAVSGLLAAGVSEIYYILMALRDGEPMSQSEVSQVALTLITKVEQSGSLESLLAGLSTGYRDMIDVVDTNVDPYNYSILRFNRTGDQTTMISTTMSKSFQLYDYDIIDGKTVIQMQKYNNLTPVYGWSDLSDVESRRFSSFKKSLNNQIGNNINGREMVMWDTANDQYWAIKFNQWQGGGNGGAFAYTRTLIEDGTFSATAVTFTHSNYGDEVDVISEGVLEITRGTYGPIYNAALETESNGHGPLGTKWNTQYSYQWYDYTHTVVGGDCQPISTIQTEEYNNDWDGRLHVVKDEINQKTYVSNTQFGGAYQELNKVYGNYDWINSWLTEDNIYPAKVLYDSGNKFRVITDTQIYEEFTVPQVDNFIKIDNHRIGDEVVLIVRTSFSLGTEFLFYSFSGELVNSFSVPDGLPGMNMDYNMQLMGRRVYVVWSYFAGSNRNFVMYRDGQLTEMSLDGTSYGDVPNDYYIWD